MPTLLDQVDAQPPVVAKVNLYPFTLDLGGGTTMKQLYEGTAGASVEGEATQI